MTPVQLAVLDYYRERVAVGGFVPTRAEAARRFGVTTTRIGRVLEALEQQGFLVRHPGHPRRYELAGVVSLVGVPSDLLRAELARRGEVLDALDGGEQRALGGQRRSGAGDGICAAPGCQLQVQRGHLMCLSHWRALPFPLRKQIVSAHFAARRTRCPEDAQTYGDAVAEARAFLEGGH
jgi:hypothetical protein